MTLSTCNVSSKSSSRYMPGLIACQVDQAVTSLPSNARGASHQFGLADTRQEVRRGISAPSRYNRISLTLQSSFFSLVWTTRSALTARLGSRNHTAYLGR